MNKHNSYNIILVNTFATYSRSILTAGLTLYSSRWVLNTLGSTDFGIYSLVGSLIIFLSFFNDFMSTSASRHFSFEIGRNVANETNKWFNSTLLIHIIILIIIFIIGLPIGLYFINNIFEIEYSRVFSSKIVFSVSLIASLFSMLSVPYVAMYIAKQKFVFLSIVALVQSIFSFLIAFVIRYIEGDKLIFFSILMSINYIIIALIQIFIASFYFSETKIRSKYLFEKKRSRQILSFAFWNFIGNFGHLVRSQGLAFLTNLFFGTRGNTVFGISNQLSTQTSSLTNALSSSVTPEIIRNEGAGDSKKAIDLTFHSAKLGIFLILLLSIPLLVETKTILKLWLVNVPNKTAELCVLMIVVFLIEKTGIGFMQLLQAVNKISKPQICLGILFSMSIVFAYILILFGFGIESIGLSVIISMLLSRFVLFYWIKRYTNLSISKWIQDVIIPYLIIFLVSYMISYISRYLMIPSFGRIILVFLINLLSVSILSWLILLKNNERVYFKNFLLKFYHNE